MVLPTYTRFGYPLGRLTVVVLLIVAFGGLLSGCGNSSSSSQGSASGSGGSASTADASTPFRVLYICPLSGPLAAAGAEELDGLKAATASVNSQGGILGHRLQVTTMDDQGVGTKAVAAAQQALASGTQYNMIIAGCFDQDGIPATAVLAKTPVVQIAPLPDSIVLSRKLPYAFFAGSLTSASEVAMAQEMRSKGITKFAIVTGGDASGQSGAQELTAAAKKLGIVLTATEFVPDSSVDATPQVEAALASHPQALAVNNYTPVIGPILKARTKLGATVPLYGDAYFTAANLALTTTQQDRRGVYEEAFPALVAGTAAQQTPAWKAFEQYDSQYDPKPALSLYADMTEWDALMEVRAAAVKARTISGAAVPHALASLTLASQVPGFVGGTHVNAPDYQAWLLTPSDYWYGPAGVTRNGILYPGT